MSVFAVESYEGHVLRVFSERAAAESFVSQVQALDVLHEAWVFSPASALADFVAPEGFEGLEAFCGLDVYGVVEFELH